MTSRNFHRSVLALFLILTMLARVKEILDYFLHLDVKLAELIVQHGVWIYAILFAIIFCETGLVVTPFLPGDSLLFAVGAVSHTAPLNLWYCGILMLVAAILGDIVNYWIGRLAGQWMTVTPMPLGQRWPKQSVSPRRRAAASPSLSPTPSSSPGMATISAA